MSRIGHTPMCERGAHCHIACPGCPGGPSIAAIEAAAQRLMERANMSNEPKEDAPMTGQATPYGSFMERWEWPTGELQYLFHCPACKGTHAYWLSHAAGHNGPIWQLSGTPERPSFSPSLRVRSRDESGETVCHLFVTDGQIIYCGDCTHEFAGKTVPMEKLA